MNEDFMENWLHATDDERETTHASWKVDTGEGKDIALGVATLLKEECVYNVGEIDVNTDSGRWIIHAFVDPDDYESLKNRTNIAFLGFRVAFFDIGTFDANP